MWLQWIENQKDVHKKCGRHSDTHTLNKIQLKMMLGAEEAKANAIEEKIHTNHIRWHKAVSILPEKNGV